MMYRFSLFLIFCSGVVFGQKQANIWYFGNGAGLDFNDKCNVAVLTDGAINAYEGCVTISSNSTGELLFYTNSDSVWNNNHQAMPNSHLVDNGSTITQVLILQKPGSASIYYIFTSEVQATGGIGLQLHQVDMTLNAGLGGLTFKDSLIYAAPLTEKITAVQHSNGTDYWLLAHAYNSTNFLAFLVSASGVSLVPVISPIGKVHGDPSTFDAIGELKASPDGTKLAAVTMRQPNVELFDFNAANGQVSNLITLPENGAYDLSGNSSGLYGLSFSSNSEMLYVTRMLAPSSGVTGQLFQYNVSSNDSTTINDSRVNIFSSETKSLYSLKLAPDKKIYVGQNFADSLGVIEDPNSPGTACNYMDNGIYLEGKLSSWGLNNLPEYNVYCVDYAANAQEENAGFQLSVYPNPVNGFCTVELQKTEGETFVCKIMDVQGKVLLVIDEIQHEQFQLDCSQLAPGVYFLQLTSDHQNSASLRFVVE